MKPVRVTLVAKLVLLVLLALAATEIPAATYCAGTVAQLQSAIASINQSEYEDFDLRIRSGYYTLAPVAGQQHALRISRWFRPAAGQTGQLRISGGWNAGCTQQATNMSAANSTVLDGQGQTGILEVRPNVFGYIDFPLHQTLRIDSLLFYRGASPSGFPGGLYFNQNSVPAGGTETEFTLVVERVRFDDCHDALYLGRHYGALVRNSVFVGNTGAYGSAMNIVATEGSAWVYNNTFRYNHSTDPSFASIVYLQGTATRYFHNNIVADSVLPPSASHEIYLSNGTTFLRNNRIASPIRLGGTAAAVPNGNTTANPGFKNAFDVRLGDASPLRDFGLAVTPGYSIGNVDFDGSPRLQGAFPEPGAFELAPLPALPAAVFGNGFE
ncbi:MAG TPA: hypothetical protein PKZ76_07440 [Xanthomonadaceae bacterium]|nr:hypothetical protein [Xanthomonadaceae bacterium]